MRTWIIAIAKCEELYIREWIAYHKSIGISHIIIADNNDSSYDNDLSQVIQDYIDEGYVEVTDWKDKKAIQIECYNVTYKSIRNKCDYVAFIDIDEFITLPAYDSVNDFIQHMPDVDAIMIPWLIYDDNDLICYDPRPVRERFTRPTRQFRHAMQTKTIYRCSTVNEICHQHAPAKKLGLKTCDSLGRLSPYVALDLFNSRIKATDEHYANAYVAHYMTKTAGEYAMIKMTRGRVQNNHTIRYDRRYFYNINKKTDYKELMFDRFEDKARQYNELYFCTYVHKT